MARREARAGIASRAHRSYGSPASASVVGPGGTPPDAAGLDAQARRAFADGDGGAPRLHEVDCAPSEGGAVETLVAGLVDDPVRADVEHALGLERWASRPLGKRLRAPDSSSRDPSLCVPSRRNARRARRARPAWAPAGSPTRGALARSPAGMSMAHRAESVESRSTQNAPSRRARSSLRNAPLRISSRSSSRVRTRPSVSFSRR